MCSDHFHPWSERQGQSGFAWSWLGSALESTSLSFGTVCAPGQRYHPTVIAQAAATLAEMYPGRFWIALGTGEALNETVTGGSWPPKPDSTARLDECVEVMRALWSGETVTIRGRFIAAAGARLYSKPARPPLLLGAALTPDTARRASKWADGLITVAGPRDTMREVLDAFREGGGEEKPVMLQVTLSFAPTDEEAVNAAYDQWRHCAVSTSQLADLATPADFDRASHKARISSVLEKVRSSSDVEQHLAWLQEDATLGYSGIYLHNVARTYQPQFIEACGTRLIPAMAAADDAFVAATARQDSGAG